MTILESLKEKVRLGVEEIVMVEGAQLVEFKVFPLKGSYALRCLIDYPQGGITAEVCARANSKIVSYLASTHTLGDDFSVEVNSPGLDRRLNQRDDFLRVKGRFVCLWLSEPHQGSIYLEAELIDVHNDKLILKYKEGIVELGLDKIKVGKEKIEI